MIAESVIRTAVVNKIIANDATARVYRRHRFPSGDQLAEYVRLFVNAGQINTYMVRRLRRIPEVHGIPKRLVSVTHDYGITFFYGLVDDDSDDVASEEIMQATIESLAALFEADNTIGLGHSIGHEGLALPADLSDGMLGSWKCLHAALRLRVTAQDC